MFTKCFLMETVTKFVTVAKFYSLQRIWGGSGGKTFLSLDVAMDSSAR
jgi:hypothetical protein